VYLKRIEITGFKSFATKTVLDFLPSCSIESKGKLCGITAIVGPNGSGKSNVADAIKWAMGEQSLKNLRGKKSEDVIFAGSGKKAQLGSAKVSLVFDNSDKKIPIEYEEVVITRKIHRSGEGEYAINGSRVRLIDIADLLAKAGVGQRSYCIINQGMADSILNATPVERRVILEEAAGVKPFQLKKERSLRKLDSTRNNLQRVGDLVKEIEPHLRVLRRQSEKARRGEEVSGSLKAKQNELFSFLWSRIKKEKNKINEEKEEVGREEMKLQRRVDDLEIRLKKESGANSDFEGKRDVLEKEREEIFEGINSLRREISIIEAKIEIEKEKAKNVNLINQIPVDLPYVKNKVKEILAEYQEIENKANRVTDLAGLEALKTNLFSFKARINKFYQEINDGKIEETATSRQNTVDLRIVGEMEGRKKEFSAKLSILSQKSEANKASMEQLIAEDRKARQEYFELERELRSLQEVLNGFRDRSNEVKIRMARIEVREEDLEKRIKIDLNVNSPDDVLKDYLETENLDVEQLEREIGRLKVLSEQIGAIDPMIIEEFEETQKRFDFLTSQSEDLEKAIVTLADIIKEMDLKIRGSFEETFKRVNDEFSKYFKIIFGGGNAELTRIQIENRRLSKGQLDDPELEDEEQLEEKEKQKELGIEIKACPPGKRISGLNMLSGGERTLTSQALLFAIISNNPPPFTVMDEVEAALDEANSKRFGRILQELSNHTQFILISHNRETMRQALALYGVTMGPDGVSKVLSVKLDQVGEKGEIR
jgi:chromosome segregation protein